MPFIMKAKITDDARVTTRVMRQVVNATHQYGGVLWVEKFLPLHFQQGASGRYGYKPRTEKHKKRKGYAPALVMSGATGQQARASVGGVRGFPTRTTFTLYTPSYIPQRPRRRKMPDMAAEIFTVIPSEMQFIERKESQFAEKEIRRLSRPHTVRIG